MPEHVQRELPYGRALELGCGTGFFLLNLIPFLPLDDKLWTVRELEVFLKALLPDLAAQTLLDSMRGAIDNAIGQRRGGVLSASLLVALWAASPHTHRGMTWDFALGSSRRP